MCTVYKVSSRDPIPVNLCFVSDIESLPVCAWCLTNIKSDMFVLFLFQTVTTDGSYFYELLGALWNVLSCCCSFWLLCSMGKHGRFYLQTMSSCVYHIRTNQSTTFPWSTARVHHTARILDWHYHCTTLVYMLFTFCFLHFYKELSRFNKPLGSQKTSFLTERSSAEILSLLICCSPSACFVIKF